jgi:hypothetical protein
MNELSDGAPMVYKRREAHPEMAAVTGAAAGGYR